MNVNMQKRKESIFTLAYSLILFSIVYTNTYLPFTNTNFVMDITMVLSIVIIILKIIMYDIPTINLKKVNVFKLVLLILFAVATIITVSNRYRPPLLVFLFVIGARGIDFNKIIKIYIRVVGIILIISVIASSFGLIINSKITREGVLRQAFGYKYPTAFVNILNTVFMAELYEYLSYKNVKVSGIFVRDFVYLIVSFITLRLSDTRADSAITFLLIPVSIFLYFKYSKNYTFSRKKINKLLIFLLSSSFYIFGLLSYIIVTLFIKNPYQLNLKNLDVFLSRRLSLTAYAVQHYGYLIFGKKIIFGDLVDGQYTFYLDSNYYMFFIEYGILLFLLVGIIYFYVIRRELSKGNIAFVIIVIILAFMGMLEEHFYAIETNPFLLAVLASNVSSETPKLRKRRL